MKKIILCIMTFTLLVSCATAPLEISENDDKLRMVGGKEALLDAIVYPDFALRKGIEGVVTVLAYVDTAGSVGECKIIEGNDYLNDAALSALKIQKFHPYILDGKKRPVRVAIPISFTISKNIIVKEFEKERIMAFADYYLKEPILTLPDFPTDRSPGPKNAFYSEGRSWWPNPDDPDGPYIFQDDLTNPDAFRQHAGLVNRAGEIISGLTAAYVLTKKADYAQRALEHINAWFITPETRMTAHMKYAQAIPNRSTGRDVGIYESLALVEILQSIPYLESFLTVEEKISIDSWFEDFADFLVDDTKGMTVRMRKDTYGTAWLLQITAIARYLDDKFLMGNCEEYFQQFSLPHTANYDSPLFNAQKNRTFNDNIFLNADIMALITHLITDHDYNAWGQKINSGQRVGDIVNYLYSGILNNELKTAGHYDGRYLSLLFAGKAYDNPRYLELWRDLQAGEDKAGDFPIRQPLLWIK
ncbi:MAG: TonB family protein [Candidatus Marinimicrobia bacterium]|nr:TonB family protein [Candidatus Neomarinimicrobiota bacterium]